MNNLQSLAGIELSRVVEGIRNGDDAAAQDLYDSFNWLRTYFGTKLGWQEAEDSYHDLVVAVVTAIRTGTLREPARLAGYARMAARNIVADRIRSRLNAREVELHESCRAVKDDRPSAEATAIRRQAKAIAARLLGAMPSRDRAVLVRFYVDEDRPEQICSEMNLSATQFRLIKSRAKARFTALLQQRIRPNRAQHRYV